MEQTITCIRCPVGCRLTVQVEDGNVISVSGNECKRGDAYARTECVAPERMVTAVLPVKGSKVPVSVKTRNPIPKAMIRRCMEALAQTEVTLPVHAGDVLLSQVDGVVVDVIATKSIIH